MKKLFAIVAVTITLLALDACKTKNGVDFSADKLEGVWRIDQFEINGSVLQHENIGKPKIEFRGNQYHWNTAGVTEDGRFTLNDSTLTFDCTSDSLKSDAVFKVTKMDSTVVEYYSQTDNNRMNVTLLRISK